MRCREFENQNVYSLKSFVRPLAGLRLKNGRSPRAVPRNRTGRVAPWVESASLGGFHQTLQSIILDSAFARFQGIEGTASIGGQLITFDEASGFGLNSGVNINPLAEVTLPAAAWMFLAGMVGLGLVARRRGKATMARAAA